MDTKQCRTCKEVFGLDRFYKHGPRGFSGECKACKGIRARKHYRENTARHAFLVKRRYDTHNRFARYGLKRDDYDAALERQGHRCALCLAEKPGGKGKWHIDHTHDGPKKRGFHISDAHQFRGLLCHRCNVALGHFEKLVSRVGLDAILRYAERGFVDEKPAQDASVSGLC